MRAQTWNGEWTLAKAAAAELRASKSNTKAFFRRAVSYVGYRKRRG